MRKFAANGRSILLIAGFVTGIFAYAPSSMGIMGLLRASSVSGLTLAMRLLSVGCILLGCLPADLRGLRISDAAFGLGIFAAIALFLSRGASANELDRLFWNGVLVAPLFVLLPLSARQIDFTRIWSAIALCAGVQVILGLELRACGIQFTDNSGLIGAVGNANMFGLLCGLSLLQVLIRPLPVFPVWMPGPFLAAGAVLTGSLTTIVAVTAAVAAGAWARPKSRRALRVVVPAAVVIIMAAMIPDLIQGKRLQPLEHAAYKLASLWNSVSAVEALTAEVPPDIKGEVPDIPEVSSSVSLRTRNWSGYVRSCRDRPAIIAVGSIDGTRYWPVDSQWLTYAGSFGVAVATLIFMPIIRVLPRRFNLSGITSAQYLALALACAYVLANRSFDYFVGALLTALVVAEVRMGSPQRGRPVSDSPAALREPV